MNQNNQDNTTPDEFAFPKAWTLFGPVGKDDPEPKFAGMNAIPKELNIAGKRLAGRRAVFTDNRLDLGAMLGGRVENKTAYLFAEFAVDKDIEVELGAGADWWMKWWVDGEVVCDTLATGNTAQPPSIRDHRFTARLKAGRNLVAVKVVSGSISFVLAATDGAELRAELHREEVRRQEEKAVLDVWRAVSISWSDLIDRAKRSTPPARYAPFIEAARVRLSADIFRRVLRPEHIGQYRYSFAGPAQFDANALWVADHASTYALMRELPLLAAAFRLTGEEQFRQRVIAQLREMSSWSPLQRPGAVVGSWLATGQGIRAIADTLEVMPPETIDPDLLKALHELLAKEIAGIVDDWACKRQWFVQSNNVITNQWVLPNEGLIRACLVLGPAANREAYELGIRNMLASLDAHSPAGEFEEGMHYGVYTVSAILHTARATARANDPRLILHPYLRSFPGWMIQNLQPGRRIVNAFDCCTSSYPPKSMTGDLDKAGSFNDQYHEALSLMAVMGIAPAAYWVLDRFFDSPSLDLAGIASCGLGSPDKQAAPPLFASYQRATCVTWRDRWEVDASGVWVRGGHELDQHDHQDRGHVSFTSRGRPILIECGTPRYHQPRIHRDFISCIGHNVLQLGTAGADPSRADMDHYRHPPAGWQKRGAVAPITVRSLTSSGGDVRVDGTGGYDGLQHWHRDVAWTAEELRVRDDVELAAGAPQTIRFRWHLGTESPVKIEGEGCRFRVSWPDASITIEASQPVAVTQVMWVDNSLTQREYDDESPDHLHVCIIVESTGAVAELRVESVFV